ncbi:MAG: glycosyltransferase [Lachnospiraceae bacterium]|nr:glycosyltransferase [Lachnospiraceae bacterium]
MVECKQPLISIIVPVYQVKDYVGECVESLLRQTYTNLEILLVDDGSTDGSGAICDEYASKDNRIRVIHQDNQGLSAARNTGLDWAAGEYVAFVDSDDAVLPDFIETLYDLADRYHADIAACAYERGEIGAAGIQIKNDIHVANQFRDKIAYEVADRDDHSKYDGSVTEIYMTSEQMLRQWHGRYKKWETVAWNKLYRKRILDSSNGSDAIRFPVGRRHEDVLTSHLIVANAGRIVLTTQKLYMYRTREDSITSQVMTAEHRKENLLAQRERMDFFRKRRYWRAYLNLLIGYVLHLGWFGWKKVKERK